MALQGGAGFEQVQMRGHGGGGGNRGGGMSVGRSGGGGGGTNVGRSGGGGMSFNRSSGGNWSGNRAIRGGNFATNNRPGNWSGGNNWNGRRNFADWRNHRRGFRGPVVAFGFGPSYYDYGYDYGYGSGYYPYDDESYAYVAPGAAVEGDSVAYCQQRFRSYDPSTGTYLGYDGLRHPCP